jgi:NAD(P)-dependent dehydrogenase (short-subunit alcohol dehydrogenase family)
MKFVVAVVTLVACVSMLEAQRTALWLCSPGASYVVGHALTVDGGMTVA